MRKRGSKLSFTWTTWMYLKYLELPIYGYLTQFTGCFKVFLDNFTYYYKVDCLLCIICDTHKTFIFLLILANISRSLNYLCLGNFLRQKH